VRFQVAGQYQVDHMFGPPSIAPFDDQYPFNAGWNPAWAEKQTDPASGATVYVLKPTVTGDDDGHVVSINTAAQQYFVNPFDFHPYDFASLTSTPKLTWIPDYAGEVPQENALVWLDSRCLVSGDTLGEIGALMDVHNGIGTQPDNPVTEPSNLLPLGQHWSGTKSVHGGKFYVVPTGSGLTIGPPATGYNVVMPSLTQSAAFKALFPPSQNAAAQLGMSLNIDPNIKLSPAPAPRGAGLLPCPVPTIRPILNQYVMDGANTCVVPVSIYSASSSSAATSTTAQSSAYFLQHADWQLARNPVIPGSTTTAPFLSQFPVIGNHLQLPSGVAPQYIDPFISLSNFISLGFGFHYLPSDNACFGEYQIKHLVDGNVIGTSPIAMFYEQSLTTHPLGGPPGYDHTYPGSSGFPDDGSNNYASENQIDTPNWWYYYNQACAGQPGWAPNGENGYAPWGFKIHFYRHGDGNTSIYYDGQDHVHIAGNAKGETSRDRFAIPASYPYVTVVGSQTCRGIDSYVRTVTHECTHKKVYEYMTNTVPRPTDSDGDMLPDSVENAVGLNPGATETITFTVGGITMGWAELNGYNNPGRSDFEVYAYMCEVDLHGNIDADWAADTVTPGDAGLNYFSPPTVPTAFIPPDRCARDIEVIKPAFRASTLIFKDGANARAATP
jgi:hypothetical protein